MKAFRRLCIVVITVFLLLPAVLNLFLVGAKDRNKGIYRVEAKRLADEISFLRLSSIFSRRRFIPHVNFPKKWLFSSLFLLMIGLLYYIREHIIVPFGRLNDVPNAVIIFPNRELRSRDGKLGSISRLYPCDDNT